MKAANARGVWPPNNSRRRTRRLEEASAARAAARVADIAESLRARRDDATRATRLLESDEKGDSDRVGDALEETRLTWSESAESNPAIDALERELRAATDANDATRRRLSRESSSSSDVVAVADADARLRAAADQLIAQQARAEAIASEKATLAFRLESAREEIRAGGGGLLNLGTARGAGRRRSAAMDDDGRRWTSTVDDDANDDGTGREQARAPKQLAYAVASAAFGRDRRLARDVANAWGAVDDASLAILSTWSRHAGARAAVMAYVWIMHLYLFALVVYGGKGPKATNTETATLESLHP